MSYKWKPSKTARVDFANKMKEIEEFCKNNNIQKSLSGDSYYFSINGIPYRVSNHTVEASDKGMYLTTNEFTGEFEKVRDSYHEYDDENTVYITAGKTRIIEIYNNLIAGKKLDKRGNVVC